MYRQTGCGRRWKENTMGVEFMYFPRVFFWLWKGKLNWTPYHCVFLSPPVTCSCFVSFPWIFNTFCSHFSPVFFYVIACWSIVKVNITREVFINYSSSSSSSSSSSCCCCCCSSYWENVRTFFVRSCQQRAKYRGKSTKHNEKKFHRVMTYGRDYTCEWESWWSHTN